MIYEDRVKTWQRMKILDPELDQSPTEEQVKEMAELRIRNLLCYEELEALNSKGAFLNKHPFLIHRKEMSELRGLWNSDREKFIQEYSNCQSNIRRYRGRLNLGRLTPEEKENCTALLLKHKERQDIFKKIMNNETDDNSL